MKCLIIPSLLLIFLRFCVGLEITDDCLIVPDRKHMKNAETNFAPQRPKRLFLMPSITNDREHKALNNKLIIWGKDLGFTFEIVSIPSWCRDDYQFYYFNTTVALSQNYDIINLKVNIPFYDVDEFEKRSELSIVGSTYLEFTTIEVCKSTENNNDEGYETCEHTTEDITTLYGKLISNSIKSYKLLYEILENIDSDYDFKKQIYWQKYKQVSKYGPIKRHSIIICANVNVTFVMKSNQHIVYNCENINDFIEHDAIAVIAPSPFKNEELTYLPVVFYEEITPHLLPKDKVVYPKSTTLYGDYFQEMADRLMQFIQLQSWSRIAIVTDDSPYSQNFEELMTNYFDKYNLIYSAHQCTGLTCDFHESLQWLKNADARIIIANVDNKNAKLLMETAKKVQLTAKENVLWIFRAGCLEDYHSYDIYSNLQEILYVTVSPDDFSGITREEKSKRAILKALSYFEDANIYKNNQSGEIRTHTSTLIKKIEDLQRQPVVYIRRITDTSYEVVFNSTNMLNPLWKKVEYADEDQNCSFRKFGYPSGCEDMYPLIMLLVILGLLLVVLFTILIYRKISNRGLNYRPFY